jgi:hypothetical protein
VTVSAVRGVAGAGARARGDDRSGFRFSWK